MADNCSGLEILRRSFIRGASSGGIVAGPGGKGKNKALFVGVFFSSGGVGIGYE